MNYNEIFELKLQLIINKKLYNKKIIDENTYTNVNEKLLNKINNAKGN